MKKVLEAGAFGGGVGTSKTRGRVCRNSHFAKDALTHGGYLTGLCVSRESWLGTGHQWSVGTKAALHYLQLGETA